MSLPVSRQSHRLIRNVTLITTSRTTTSSLSSTTTTRPFHSQHPAALQQQQPDSSKSQEAQPEPKESVSGRTPPGPKNGAKPKILDTAPDPNPPEDVKRHNAEFEKRHDRAEGKINPDGKDNVGKGFWSGQGGVDRQA